MARIRVPRHSLIPRIPERLRGFKSAGDYGTAELRDSIGTTYLVWSEVVGKRMVVVFHHGHPGRATLVAILSAKQDLVRLMSLEPRNLPEFVEQGKKVTIPGASDSDDAYTLANKAGIMVAMRWVAKLREGFIPGGERRSTPEQEAWLRQQLDGLGGGPR